MTSRHYSIAIGLAASLLFAWGMPYQPRLSALTAAQVDRLSAQLHAQPGSQSAGLAGVPASSENLRAASSQLRMAAQQGNTDAMRALGGALLPNADYALAMEGLHFAEEAAKRGDADAQFLLALAYFDGTATLTKLPDMGRARTWFEMAAEHNHGQAMFYLGRIHQFGYGVRPDAFLAAHWLKRAADAGNRDAALALAQDELKSSTSSDPDGFPK